jgi:hypothetical protein
MGSIFDKYVTVNDSGLSFFLTVTAPKTHYSYVLIRPPWVSIHWVEVSVGSVSVENEAPSRKARTKHGKAD